MSHVSVRTGQIEAGEKLKLKLIANNGNTRRQEGIMMILDTPGTAAVRIPISL